MIVSVCICECVLVCFCACVYVSVCVTCLFFIFSERTSLASLRGLFSKSRARLTCWSQLDSLLSFTAGAADVKEAGLMSKIQAHISALQALCKDDSCEIDDNDVDYQNSETFMERLSFLVEQLHLVTSKRKRYSSDTLLWALHVY